jgi:DNA sulfur modification protein DndD
LILKKLVINNFRQYLGRQELIFASQKQKNVTIIHGENGFGKTCFLNALLWGFYGADGLTKDLPQAEHIIPDSVRENSVNPSGDVSSIEISFKHGDREFTLVRSISLSEERASKGQKANLNLAIQHLDGQTTNSDNREAQKIIDSILPKDLRELVFFNGERIDHLAMEENAVKVRDSVRGLLGLQLIDQAIEDLNDKGVRGKLKDELKRNTDAETGELIEKQNALEIALSEHKKELATCRQNQAALAEKIATINAKLEANREARELQQKRATLESQLNESQKKIQELEKKLSDLLATDGYTLFCLDLIERGKSITKKLRAENRIPARVQNNFIYDILNNEKCICGTCLPKGSEIWKVVQEQLINAGDPEFNQAVSDLDKAIASIDSSIPRTRESIMNQVGARANLIEKISQIREELEEIREALGAKDDEEIQALEAQRERDELRSRELLRDEGILTNKIESAEADLKKLSAEIQAKKQRGEEGMKAQRRLHQLEAVVSLLQEILDIETEDLGNELGKEIERIFRKMSLHDYRLELKKDFTLRLSKAVATSSGLVQVNVATSTGQRQVMSLVFIASLVALAQRRNEIPTILKDLHGGDYPLVMDSPFGAMGEAFREAIAKYVPSLAPQTIVLVSTSQYRGDVERELGKSGRVGKRYILRYHAPSKREDAKESITLGDKKFVIFKKDDIEHTQIQEVEL